MIIDALLLIKVFIKLCRRHRRCGSIPGLGRSAGGGHSNPLQYPGEWHGKGSLASYSPLGHKESDAIRAT